MKYLTIIEDYFLGKLKGKDNKEFLSELNSNSELKKEYEIYKKALDFTLSQEKKLKSEIKKMKNFDLDPRILLEINKYKGKIPLSEDEKRLIDLFQSEKSISAKKRCPFMEICYNWIKRAFILRHTLVL